MSAAFTRIIFCRVSLRAFILAFNQTLKHLPCFIPHEQRAHANDLGRSPLHVFNSFFFCFFFTCNSKNITRREGVFFSVLLIKQQVQAVRLSILKICFVLYSDP